MEQSFLYKLFRVHRPSSIGETSTTYPHAIIITAIIIFMGRRISHKSSDWWLTWVLPLQCVIGEWLPRQGWIAERWMGTFNQISRITSAQRCRQRSMFHSPFQQKKLWACKALILHPQFMKTSSKYLVPIHDTIWPCCSPSNVMILWHRSGFCAFDFTFGCNVRLGLVLSLSFCGCIRIPPEAALGKIDSSNKYVSQLQSRRHRWGMHYSKIR